MFLALKVIIGQPGLFLKSDSTRLRLREEQVETEQAQEPGERSVARSGIQACPDARKKYAGEGVDRT
jgi:hypothetical protein